MSRIDLIEKFFEKEGLQPWHYRSAFELIFTIEAINPLFGEPNALQFLPQDLTGATIRYVLREKREELPARIPVYDFEKIEGGAGDAHITFSATPTDGTVTITWDEDDTDAKPKRGYWYQLYLKVPGSKREVIIEGEQDILEATDVTTAVDTEV